MDWTLPAETARAEEAAATDGGSLTTRLHGDPAALAEQLPELGPVTLKAQNRYASHAITEALSHAEWTGNALWLGGRESALWFYPAQWDFAAAVTEGGPAGRQERLEFVDRTGEAGVRAELTPASAAGVFARLVRSHRAPNVRRPVITGRATAPLFPGIARYAVDPSLIRELLETLADAAIAVRIELGNRGALQSYTGLIDNPLPTPEGLLVRGAGFRLDLSLAAVASAWVAEMHVADGRAHVVDLFDADGGRVLRLAGKRVPGCPEERAWRTLVEALSPCRLAS
ncbi:hypothetical protein [Thiohalorhabdus methylotrophus]|uniref:Haemin-degrading HemS/ChuX domain-containing protein n=1 Tax=Thiohalorhabdus methylotrophus TaxID=3242694 RepID=A0ABV4TSI0_9GAMM